MPTYTLTRLLTHLTFWEWFAFELSRRDYGVSYALTFSKDQISDYLIWC